MIYLTYKIFMWRYYYTNSDIASLILTFRLFKTFNKILQITDNGLKKIK